MLPLEHDRGVTNRRTPLGEVLNSSVISGACGLVAALVVSVGGVNAIQSATAGDPVPKSSLGGYSDE